MAIDIDPSNYSKFPRAGGGFALIPKSADAGQQHYHENKITFGAIPCDREGTPHKGAGPFRARFRGTINRVVAHA